MRKLITILSSLVLLLSLTGGAMAAQPNKEKGGNAAHKPKADNLHSPLADKQAALKQNALAKVLKGEKKAKGPNKVVKLAPGQYVELARQGEDSIWTTLGEFSTAEHPSYLGGTPGPAHNQIVEPNRAVDNATIWEDDFSQPYYQDLLFSGAAGDVSMRNFYIEQSSNVYTVNGQVEDWVQVPYNEARYGRFDSTVWRFVNDSIDGWYAAMVADGWTDADFTAYLTEYDTWDRYDTDGDGDFDEPDGYIDHYQAVHAGEGEETGGGAQGEDAIWSHRWYAWFPGSAPGPDGAGPGGLQGTRIGNTNFWIGDYTVEPENGGVGVFAHEFGHDLGLPDLYDVSGNTGGAENSTGFWTLMSSGSYGNTGVASEGIGSKPIPLSAYEKIFLDWSNAAVVDYGESASVKLSAASLSTRQNQSIIALLPDKEVTFDVGQPYAGDWMYFSGAGNDLHNSMTRSVALPAGAVGLSAKVKYDSEVDYDYGYVTVNGEPVDTNLSVHNAISEFGIDGSSDGLWVDLTADLSAFAGQTVTIGLEYITDGGVAEDGFFFDNIQISGQLLDGAETDTGWTFDGFSRTQETVTRSFFNAYLVEYRAYTGYDAGLRTGPYNFGWATDSVLFNWVEHFPYQDGLLVWYYDTSFADNGVGDNCAKGRCGGLYLPVDAHPNLLLRPDGKVWRPRIQSYDSTFGKQATDPICLHQNGVERCYPSLRANPVFNDNNSYWVAPDASINNFGWASVQVPHTGTVIKVVNTSNGGNFMKVVVNP